jgi:thymidylate kinase
LKIADRVVIVEGTDGVGKSTLAASLAEHYGCQLLWLSRPEKGKAFEFYMRAYLDQIEDNMVIMDRSHWSEEVYGSVFRDGSEFTTQQLALLDALVSTAKPVVVHCVLDNETISDNQAQAPGDDHHGEDPEKVQAKYREVLLYCGFPVLKYNYKMETAKELVERIEFHVSDKY